MLFTPAGDRRKCFAHARRGAGPYLVAEEQKRGAQERHAPACKNCSRFQVQYSRVKFERKSRKLIAFRLDAKSRAVTDQVDY